MLHKDFNVKQEQPVCSHIRLNITLIDGMMVCVTQMNLLHDDLCFGLIWCIV